jgi:NAD+ kinase
VKVALVANPNKPLAIALARRAEERLRGAADVVVAPETEEQARTGATSRPLEGLDVDVVLAIGGDGTFLHTLQRTLRPVLPINAGTVGFLAEIDGAETAAFDGALDRLLKGEYFVEPRMKLAAQVDGTSLPDATNEVVVHTSQVAKMRQFEIAVDGRPVGRLRADGMILATPTGSTSYSLSALGPILDPGVEGIIVSALAPFQATQRAVIVDPLRTVSVRLISPEKEGVAVVDGQGETRLAGGSTVVVYRSPRRAEMIRFGSRFFGRLQGKQILPWTEEILASEGGDDAGLPPAP